MNVNVADLKVIRAKTKAGMLDCTKALDQAKGDLSLAETLLKEWGLAGVEDRAERAAREGRIFIRSENAKAAMVELACETDFVSRGDTFFATGEGIARIAFERKLLAPDAETEGLAAELAAVLKENIALRRVAFLEAGRTERLYSYLHADGRIGVLLLAAADTAAAFEDDRVAAFFHDLALHVAAFHPLFLEEAAIPASYIAEKTEEFRTQVDQDERMAGKSAAILDGAVAGKLRKHVADVCLLNRGFVKDEKIPVGRVMRELGGERGFELSVKSFAYFGIGEGDVSDGEAGGEA